jgi:hypothetical protein
MIAQERRLRSRHCSGVSMLVRSKVEHLGSFERELRKLRSPETNEIALRVTLRPGTPFLISRTASAIRAGQASSRAIQYDLRVDVLETAYVGASEPIQDRADADADNLDVYDSLSIAAARDGYYF